MTDVEEDARLAHEFLMGFLTEDERGLRKRGFFPKGSPEETKAREALGQYLLLNGWSLPDQFRIALAACFDPNVTPFPTPRRLMFKQSEKNRIKNHLANSQISEEVELLVQGGATVAAAAETVGTKYGYSDFRPITKIVQRYRKTFPGLDGRPKAKKSHT